MEKSGLIVNKIDGNYNLTERIYTFYYDTDSKLFQQDSFYTGQTIFGKTDYKSYQFQFWHNANSDTTVLINLGQGSNWEGRSLW
jgi:hypothetical protein